MQPTGIAPDPALLAHAPAITVLWKRADPATSSSPAGMTPSAAFVASVKTSGTMGIASAEHTATPIPHYGPVGPDNFTNIDQDVGTGVPMENSTSVLVFAAGATGGQNDAVNANATDGVPFGVGLAISIIVPIVIISVVALALLLYRRRRLRGSKARAEAPASAAQTSVPRGEAFHELHAHDIPLPPDHTPTAWIPRVPIELLAPKAIDDVDTTIRRLRSERERVREHLQRLRKMEELEAEERRLEQELQDQLDQDD